MSALVNFSMKNEKGEWVNYTMSINDVQDKFGNNASIFIQQTKEERENKTPKKYVGNGKVTYTDGKIVKAEWVDKPIQSTSEKMQNDLPF